MMIDLRVSDRQASLIIAALDLAKAEVNPVDSASQPWIAEYDEIIEQLWEGLDV